jgi:hypothetical protein
MRRLRLWCIFLLVLLVAGPLSGGVCLAQENTYTIQYIMTIAGADINYLGFLQGISGFKLNSYNDSGLVNVGFNNVAITGLYNRNLGIGSFRNQGSVALINIQPDAPVAPVIFSGQMFSQANNVTVGDYNYAVNMNFNGLQGSGIVILDVMAGSFSNQFTSLTVNIGKNAIPSTPLTSIFQVSHANGGTVVSLTNQQMQAIAATADNDFKYQGKQSAVANIQGVPNIQGICATTVSAGVNNQISHNVSVNVDTAK